MLRILSLKMALMEASWKTQLCLKTRKLEPKAPSRIVTGKGEIARAHKDQPTACPHPIHAWISKTALEGVDTVSWCLLSCQLALGTDAELWTEGRARSKATQSDHCSHPGEYRQLTQEQGRIHGHSKLEDIKLTLPGTAGALADGLPGTWACLRAQSMCKVQQRPPEAPYRPREAGPGRG